ncbi:hypothetical protein EYF80_053754 [Liparis tanakae]|uniref:Uncharacterized protein n=1 Tax=Liparis tanakae TaxID=230148 RepID=A0A4Z2F4K6_9TELE|nr:hypothetical protein EYF80_053754 [Liparis tanakae]
MERRLDAVRIHLRLPVRPELCRTFRGFPGRASDGQVDMTGGRKSISLLRFLSSLSFDSS